MIKPAVSLVAVAGRRRATLELATRLEREGFSGIYCPSPGDGLALCEALALVTREIPFGTSIAHIYTRHAFEYAQTAAVIHELSGGRFRFGIGVSHGPAHERLGLRPGKPLDDIRSFVAEVKSDLMGEQTILCGMLQTGSILCFDRMVAEGLVSRLEDANDRRRVYVRPTEKGQRLAAELVPLAREHEARVLAGYPPREAAALKRALKTLIARTGR